MNRNTMTNEDAGIRVSAQLQHQDERPVEEWSSAGIGNAFLFGKVMTANPDLLLELLQYSLPEYHIQRIVEAQSEADIKLSIDSHGVRLDVLIIDDRGRHIDVEMQMRDEKNIPRRMRYYEGAIDQTILEKGQNYNKLGDLVILFITPFDPFDKRGLYRYTFCNTCQGDISTDLREFLQMVSKNPEPGLYAEGSFADRVQKQVHIARRNAKWRKEYMDWEMTLRNEYEKGRERERVHTEEQRKRADAAEERADVAEKRIGAAEERADAAEERADAAEKRIDAAEERAAKAEEENRRLKEQLANLQKAK